MTAIDLSLRTGIDLETCERFIEKIQINKNGCWDWTAGLMGGGYGQFSYKGRPAYAHRWLYQKLVASVPAHLTLDHLCRNRRCVNPSHLEVVTRGENVLRGSSPAAQAARATHCPQGHPYAGSNLVVKADGSRRCRKCHAASSARRYRRMQANDRN